MKTTVHNLARSKGVPSVVTEVMLIMQAKLIALEEEMKRIFAENARATELLSRCENEMRYAGWFMHTADNPQRKDLYIDVDEFIGGVKHWQMVGSTTNNTGG